MQIELWPIDRPLPYARNPRRNDAAVPRVAASLQEFGWRQPLVVDGAGVVIVGHTRLKAALALGMTEVPVYVAAHLTPAQAKAYRIADNRSAEEADWNEDKLVAEIEGLQLADYRVSLTGLSVQEAAELLRGRGELLEPRGETAARQTNLAKKRLALSWGSVNVPITPEEALLLDQAFEAHVDEHGSPAGFALALIRDETSEEERPA